eukprot:7967909-Pyramimonas_sp.AAC.2
MWSTQGYINSRFNHSCKDLIMFRVKEGDGYAASPDGLLLSATTYFGSLSSIRKFGAVAVK